MVATDLARGLSDVSKAHFLGMLSGNLKYWTVPVEIVRPGAAEAEMMGGCLSLLVTTLGTPYEIETAGKLLLIEDIDEKPYRVERMLTHLKLAGKFDQLAACVSVILPGAAGTDRGKYQRSSRSFWLRRAFRWQPGSRRATEIKISRCPSA